MSINIRDYVNQYEFSCTLPGSGQTIKFKPLTTGQMKQLLTYEGEEKASVVENALDDLISSSVISEGFNVLDLYLQDRFFLLLEIRKKTKGGDYGFMYDCPVCNRTNIVNIQLEELEVKPMKSVEGVLEINDKLKVIVNMPTRKNQKMAMVSAEKEFKKFGATRIGLETIIHMYAHAMKRFITPDGETDDVSLEDKLFVINNSKDGFFLKLKEWQDENNFGVDFTYSHECDCGFSREDTIPFTSFFS